MHMNYSVCQRIISLAKNKLIVDSTTSAFYLLLNVLVPQQYYCPEATCQNSVRQKYYETCK